MNKNLVIMYAFIMLECRLSFEDASRIFNVDIIKLKENFNLENLDSEILYALNYLEYETNCYEEVNNRGLFKANIYIRKLRSILRNPDKEELKRKLQDFCDDLKGPNIRFVLEKEINCSYQSSEKEKILKYRLKYAVSGKEMQKMFHIHKETLVRWEKELPEGELKTRLSILRSYLDYKYTGTRSKK